MPIPKTRRTPLFAFCLLLASGTLDRANAQSEQIQSPTVTLDPFQVTTSNDKGYGELNSNSLTMFNTELSKMPVSADVFDQAFLKDVGLDTVEQVLGFYSAGAGQFSLSPDTSASNSQYLDRNGNNTFAIRGLQAPTTMLNGFFPAGSGGIAGVGVTSTFDLEKVEVVNGPQSLLYGVSGSGGVINYTLKVAQFNTPARGTASYKVDEYGHKQGILDYGVGYDRFAVRLALIDQTLGGRRVFIGGPMQGDYLQVAVKPFKNTVVTLVGEQQVFDRIYFGGSNQTLTALSTANDARNGQSLVWLLATGQLGAAANGAPTGAGPIPAINWDNVNSLAGVMSREYRDHHLYLATIDTTWTPWLSSQIAAGYKTDTDNRYNGSTVVNYNAPNVTANPTGTWAVSLSASQESVLVEPSRQKTARATLLADNHFFDGNLQSKTVLGTDATRSDNATISAFFVQADSNFSPIVGTSTTNNGYTNLPTLWWAVPNGPVQQPLFNPEQTKITYNGANYVRAVTNYGSPSLISPSNPEGLSGHGSGDFRHTSDIQSGIFLANYLDMFDGKLELLSGMRTGKSYYRNVVEASAPNPPSVLSEKDASFTTFSEGVNVKVHGNLRAYAEVSDSDNPPNSAAFDPYGHPVGIAHGLGEEAGLKYTNPATKLSGWIAVYHANSKNEEYSFTSTIVTDINPSGLNGQYGAASNIVNVNRNTQGVQATLTAAPGNWALRLSAAAGRTKIDTEVKFAQFYNDQFNANSAGVVTYADGTPVYVNPTYNSKGVIAAPQASAPTGYIPLTISMMNSATSPYYANPVAVSSAISASSAVANVLKQVDPVHGAILTGLTGLPISALQIAPNPTSPPPGTIIVTEPGDVSPGSPNYSLNFTGVYTVPGGIFKGLKIGGSSTFAWQTSLYYYYTNGVASGVTQAGAGRTLYTEPTQALFNGIIGYTHKFGRFTFASQVNIANLFNHYHVLYLPSYVNGWNGPNTATIDQQPRVWTWTNTLSF